jgi:hypothetical protein
VFGQIPRKRLNIVVGESVPQLAHTTVHNDMLMNLNITHRVILVLQSALEASFSAPEK